MFRPGSSLIEIDTTLDIAEELEYFEKEHVFQTGELIVKTFQRLSKMINY